MLESSDTSGGKRVWLNAGRSQRSNGLIALLGHRLTMLVDIFFVRFFSLIFLFIPCGRSWLYVSFLLDVNTKYRVVSYRN